MCFRGLLESLFSTVLDKLVLSGITWLCYLMTGKESVLQLSAIKYGKKI